MKYLLENRMIMDVKTFNKLIILLVLNCFSMTLSGQNKEKLLPLPTINYENALLSGHISPKVLGNIDSTDVEIRLNNPFSGEVSYKVQINKDGDFYLSIPVICQCFGVFAPESDVVRTFFWLSPGKETKLNLSLDENQKLIADCKQPIEFTSIEMSESIDLTMKMLRSVVEDKEAMKEYSFGKLVEAVVKSDKNSTKRIYSSSLSEAGKQFSIYDMKLHYVRTLFDYWHEFLDKKKI